VKKAVVLLLSLLLTVSLCACSGTKTAYTVYEDGKTFEINSERGTIFDGTHTYKYTFSGDSLHYTIKITYPNGSTYHWEHNGTFGHGGTSGNYNEDLYTRGDTLCDIIADTAPIPTNPVKVIAIILLIGVGAFYAAAPSTAWYFQHGWKYKSAEPSDFALGMNRFSGIIAIIVGILMIFF